MAITTQKAKEKAKSLGQNATMWTNQQLADFLGEDVIKYNAKGQPVVLAYSGGQAPEHASQKPLTQEQAQQKAAAYTKDDAIREIQNLAKTYYGDVGVFKPGYSASFQKELVEVTYPQRFRDLLAKVQNYGVTESEFRNIVNDTVQSSHTDAIKAYNAISQDRGGLTGFLDKATPVITNIGAALITGGMSLPQQIAVNSVLGAVQGASVSDIVRNAVGTAAASQIPKLEAVKELKKVADPTLQSAIDNALTQAIYAAATKQNIGQNVLAGAVGGAAADLAGVLSDDPAFQKAVGEFGKYISLPGFTVETATAAALGSYLSSKAGTTKPAEGDQAGLPTGQVMAAGGGAGAETDVEAPELIPSRLVGQPAQRTPGGEEAGVLPAVEVTAGRTTGLDLIRRVRTGEQAQEQERRLPEVEVIGQREPIELEKVTEAQRVAEEEGPEEEIQRQPRETVILDLISGGSAAEKAARQQRTPDERELASMQALSQALRIGDPGEPLFGGRLGRRRNVWNVESLRLKDELGG